MDNEYLLVEGLNGKRALKGKINVNGAKNSVLKIVSAIFLFEDELAVKNAPYLKDLEWLLEILHKMGVDSTYTSKEKTLKLTIKRNLNHIIDNELARKLRSSIVLTGPVFARMHKVQFPFPGGDKIGLRPIDLFLEAFSLMGAQIDETDEFINIQGQVKDVEIFFRRQSVTATETIMMAAVLSDATVILKNAAMEPELKALADFLNESGANIQGAGTHTIKIIGTRGKLLKAKRPFFVPPDRIEAGSFLALASVLADDLEIVNCNTEEMEATLEYFKYIGLNFTHNKDTIRVFDNPPAKELKMADFVTHEYPGFPTDMQAPTVAALTQMSGEALVFETIFENRFAYVEPLNLMGANILQLDTHRILVKGPSKLKGRTLRSIDIRAGLAYIIAAASAEGVSKIERIFHIDRGYENIESRLQNIGLNITRKKYD